MARVLIIDDDVSTLLGYKRVLRAANHEVATASFGEDGLAAAQRDQFDVVLCDQRLPDRPGIEVVSLIHDICPRSAIVFVTGGGTAELIREAKLAGAAECMAKPLSKDELVAVVDDAIRLHESGETECRNPVGYAVRRWTDLIAHGVFLPDDPSTVSEWCRGVAIARSTLQHRCGDVHVTPKASLDLLRLLRVVVHHEGEPWDLHGWLNTVDARTIRSLIERTGLPSDWRLVPDAESFLSHQRLIVESELIEPLRVRFIRVRHRGKSTTSGPEFTRRPGSL